MEALGDEGTELTVALVGGRRFRERCLARYLELSGVRITIGSVENLRESLSSQGTAIDLAVIDTGDHTCSDRSVTSILACLRDVLPGVPVVVLSDREDRSAVDSTLCAIAVRAYFPSSLDPEILLETLKVRAERRYVHTARRADECPCAAASERRMPKSGAQRYMA